MAATYPGKAAEELPSLIETVFAKPFCQHENADGRYGRQLRPLPEVREDEEDIRHIKIDIRQDILLNLPSPEPGFAEIINRVRGSSGKALRKAMNNLGPKTDPDFHSVRNAWRAVADEIAGLVSGKKEIKVSMFLVELGKATFWGALADLAVRPLHSIDDLPGRLVVPALGKGMEVGGHLAELIPTGLKHQQYAEVLENALECCCVKHAKIKPL